MLIFSDCHYVFGIFNHFHIFSIERGFSLHLTGKQFLVLMKLKIKYSKSQSSEIYKWKVLILKLQTLEIPNINNNYNILIINFQVCSYHNTSKVYKSFRENDVLDKTNGMCKSLSPGISSTIVY